MEGAWISLTALQILERGNEPRHERETGEPYQMTSPGADVSLIYLERRHRIHEFMLKENVDLHLAYRFSRTLGGVTGLLG